MWKARIETRAEAAESMNSASTYSEGEDMNV
jgi:hypothetical protein